METRMERKKKGLGCNGFWFDLYLNFWIIVWFFIWLKIMIEERPHNGRFQKYLLKAQTEEIKPTKQRRH